MILGSPLVEAGGTSLMEKTGLPSLVVWLAWASASPSPWVYSRWVLTQPEDGRSDGFIWRTPTITGVNVPSTV